MSSLEMELAKLECATEGWDSSKSLRKYVRAKGLLFQPALGEEKAVCNQKCLDENYDALAPLVKSMLSEDGDVTMLSLPALKSACL